MKSIPTDDKLNEILDVIATEDSLATHISNPLDNSELRAAIKKTAEFFDNATKDEIEDLIKVTFGKFGEFKPHTYYNEGLNFFEYIEEDCCTVSEYIPGSNIQLLRKWDGEKYCGIVGVEIWGFHTVAPSIVIEAYREHNKIYTRKKNLDDDMCIECGRFLADSPSKLCPGCEASNLRFSIKD
jgi:hypothetical protein